MKSIVNVKFEDSIKRKKISKLDTGDYFVYEGILFRLKAFDGSYVDAEYVAIKREEHFTDEAMVYPVDIEITVKYK